MILQDLLGDCLVTAMYGWGCNLHSDLCYPSWANLVRIAAVDVGERVAEVVG